VVLIEKGTPQTQGQLQLEEQESGDVVEKLALKQSVISMTDLDQNVQYIIKDAWNNGKDLQEIAQNIVTRHKEGSASTANSIFWALLVKT